MSLSNVWAEDLDDVSLTFLYRILNRMIENGHRGLESKSEQDIAWAVKHEYEERAALPDTRVF
ncbi:MAG TPA: hypothetical protein VGG75_14115 [Trebonia sp.]